MGLEIGILRPGIRKKPISDPGSGSATLLCSEQAIWKLFSEVLVLNSDTDLVQSPHGGSDFLGSPCRPQGWAAGCPAREARGCRWSPASAAAWWRGSAAAADRRLLSAWARPSSPPARPRTAAAACTVETASRGLEHEIMPTAAVTNNSDLGPILN